jgi:D-beta-D-heptose 7-phosphate kinase/D-beta-D-heptose 1-phosphate adenosyltransferase
MPDGSGKIREADELRPILAGLRASGRRVVFTNGCFDLLHAGHVRLLGAARALGDLLVVGLNTDRSVREIKGPRRPLTPQAERAEVLAGLASVDYVTFFDEPDPGALIAALEPDVLVKGGDWPVERIIGAAGVAARGGRVVTIPLVAGAGTSRIIARILERYAG